LRRDVRDEVEDRRFGRAVVPKRMGQVHGLSIAWKAHSSKFLEQAAGPFRPAASFLVLQSRSDVRD
jgi:hypothetical protein